MQPLNTYLLSSFCMQGTVPVAENELTGGGKEVNNEGLGPYFPQKKTLRQGFQGLDSFKTALSEDSGKGRQERGGGQTKVHGPRGPASFWSRGARFCWTRTESKYAGTFALRQALEPSRDKTHRSRGWIQRTY